VTDITESDGKGVSFN